MRAENPSSISLKDRLLVLLQQWAKVINGGISLGLLTGDINAVVPTVYLTQNTDSVNIRATFPVANVDTTFTHNLGRIPSGYIAIQANNASANLYHTNYAGWTTNVIVLKSSALCTYMVLIF